MEVHPTTRWSGAAFMAAGASVALWTAAHPWNQLTGSHAALSTAWLVSHTFHFLGGLCALAGLAGLAARPRTAATRLGTIAFALAFAGAALFTATGVFTAFLWPTLAEHASSLVELGGPFFSPPHPLIVITGLLFSAGFLLLGEALRRAGILATAEAGTLALGALLMLVPPAPLTPAPWALFVASGLVFGGGLFLLGRALRRGAAPARAGEPARAALS